MAGKDAKKEKRQNLIGKTLPQALTEEIQRSYLSYAMSVIVSRALPDVRDGMKPVARRILYTMWRQGLRSGAKFRKAAHVVGTVMAHYHPHGDMAIYDAVARLTQDFSLRYPLVDGQGNWGSIDGDRPAAPRYTEARLKAISDELLLDIEKETVNFADNYDSTRQEPLVLPSRIPQFLINGSVGIAVGMATSVPPHNLTEVCNALIHLIDKPGANVEDLMQFVQGPDFPTGAAIYDRKEILQAYATGKGSIVMRGIAEVEERKDTGLRIIVTQIPYLVNKAQLIIKIADAVKQKKIEGIRDLRDESDKEGIRIVIELKKDAYAKKVLNRLYAMTDLQKTFHVNMLALIDNGKQPKVLTLKEALEAHIVHRQEVVRRRTQFDLRRAEERAHILEGLSKALDHINEVIETIRKSQTKETAHVNLRKKFGLSEAQATAILEMRLQTLAGLERQKIQDELKEKRALIKELKAILGDPKRVMSIIKEEYTNLKERFGDERKTRVYAKSVGSFSQEDLVPDEPTIVVITRDGYIKRLALSAYQVQGRGGKGVRGRLAKEEDVVTILLTTTTHKQLLFFTNQGRVFAIPAYEIPASSRMAKGQALQNFLELGPNEQVTAVVALPTGDDRGEYVVMATRKGLVKKTSRKEFANIRRSGLRAITLRQGDALEWVAASSGQDEIILITANGQAIRFHEKDTRSMGRTAAGVKGIAMKRNDEVVTMHVVTEEEKKTAQVLVITEKGFGKRTPLGQYRLQSRAGSGIKTAAVTDKTGKVVSTSMLETAVIAQTDLLITSERGQVIRIPAASVSELSRATQGVRVMRPDSNTGKIATFTSWITAS
jgi:DNA gyrase subunit A